jgi:hypothetical protein
MGSRGFLSVCLMGDENPGATTHSLRDHFDRTIRANNILYNI